MDVMPVNFLARILRLSGASAVVVSPLLLNLRVCPSLAGEKWENGILEIPAPQLKLYNQDCKQGKQRHSIIRAFG